MIFYLNLFEGNIIRVTFPFSPEALEKVKQFSIRNWNQDIKCWEISLRIAHEIPSVLGVEIPQKIKDEYNRIYTYKPIVFNPSLLRPEIIPYPFQRVGIEFLSSHKNALLSDEVGLGKTLQSISSALHLNCKKVLVVSHGGPMWIFLSLLKEIDTDRHFIKIYNLAYIKLQSDGMDFTIKKTKGIRVKHRNK